MKLAMMRFLRRKRGNTVTETPFDQEDELQGGQDIQPPGQEEGTPAPAGPTPPPADPPTEPDDDGGDEEPT